MPVRKSRKQYYTKEQYQKAREITALDYARMQGYNLIKQGRYYTMQDHDSMIFTPKGDWWWNSRDVHGGAIEFCIYYENRSLTEAICWLAGETTPTQIPKAPKPEPEPEPAVFVMPRSSEDNSRVIDYLCRVRGLSRAVVDYMIEQKVLFEEVVKKGIHNAVFVYYDPEGNPVGAFQRGLASVPFKRTVLASNKQYGWLLQARDQPRYVSVFEAAIDCASHLTITGQWDVDRLSLEGVGAEPLWQYLKHHPQVRQVALMLDNDQAGQAAAQRIKAQLDKQGYQSEILPPLAGKDYNEMLLQLQGQKISEKEVLEHEKNLHAG